MKRASFIVLGMIVVVLPERTHAQRGAVGIGSARDCAMCHVTWVDAFDRRGANPLMDKPSEPVVSDAQTCLGCHDGSVSDSRVGVWQNHGHAAGTPIPPGMTVPESLPLENGQLACRTCHTAHAGGPETLETIDFMRAPIEGGQLCLMCHQDYAGDEGSRSHPLGELPWPLPDELKQLGITAGNDGQTMGCASCHVPHGSPESQLLVAGDIGGRMCLSCHEQLDAEQWSSEAMSRHHPVHTSPRRGDRTGADGAATHVHDREILDCFACHRMHQAKSESGLLVEPLENSQLCLTCHADQKNVLNTPHDLTVSAPDEKNLLGHTPVQTGACSACHAVHQSARKITVAPEDPSGACVTCHADGQCAPRVPQGAQSHPISFAAKWLRDNAKDSDTAIPIDRTHTQDDPSSVGLGCRSCHVPHANRHQPFLRTKPDQICSTCHVELARSLVGAHDFAATMPDVANATGRPASVTGRCGFCHGFHEGQGHLQWQATAEPLAKPDDMCRTCHVEGGLAASKTGGEMRHPGGPFTAAAHQIDTGQLPLFDEQLRAADTGQLTCATCHDVHANSNRTPTMLRAHDADDSWKWCGSCHVQDDALRRTLHSREDMTRAAKANRPARNVAYCGPCHDVHVMPDADAKGMWSAPLGQPLLPGAEQCTGCHAEGGSARAVHVTIHPPMPMRNIAPSDSPQYMPLADESGKFGAAGDITCRTCHLPHGHPPDKRPESRVPAGMTRQQRQGLDFLVRPYAVPNVCSGCHGLEGLSYYLYYHRPDKRLSGP